MENKVFFYVDRLVQFCIWHNNCEMRIVAIVNCRKLATFLFVLIKYDRWLEQKKIERRNEISVEGVKGRRRGWSQRVDENVNTRSGNITRRREKINSKNSFSVGKQRQRRRNAKGELKKGREGRGETGSSDALLFSLCIEYCDSLTSRRNSFQWICISRENNSLRPCLLFLFSPSFSFSLFSCFLSIFDR